MLEIILTTVVIILSITNIVILAKDWKENRNEKSR